MPAVNDVGEPCAGERPARFEAAGVGNGAKNLATVTGVAQPTGNRRKKGPRPYRGRSHRASSRPYRERRIRARLARDVDLPVVPDRGGRGEQVLGDAGADAGRVRPPWLPG